MQEKLRTLEEKYRHLEASFGDPALLANPAEYARRMKEYRAMEPLISKYRELCSVLRQQAEASELYASCHPIKDADLRELALAECRHLKEQEEILRRELTVLLLPRDPNDDKNVMVEIRAGTGGEEAALFASVLYRMYSMYASSAGYRISVMSANETQLGGYREIVFRDTFAPYGPAAEAVSEADIEKIVYDPDSGDMVFVRIYSVDAGVYPVAELAYFNRFDISAETYAENIG
jgi:peptide chain release factor 1